MNNLLTALATKISGSALSTDVGGRIWLDEYQDDPPIVYPYIVYFEVGGNADDVFNKHGDNHLFQFSLFSSSKSAVEIAGVYADLKALFDDCSMSITGSNLVWCKRTGPPVTAMDDITTPEGMATIKTWHIDYEITTQEA